MSKRPYTVAEIDELRHAVTLRLWSGSSCHDEYWTENVGAWIIDGLSLKGFKKDRLADVEDSVRTYMLAGITAANIYAQDAIKPPHKPGVEP